MLLGKFFVGKGSFVREVISRSERECFVGRYYKRSLNCCFCCIQGDIHTAIL